MMLRGMSLVGSRPLRSGVTVLFVLGLASTARDARAEGATDRAAAEALFQQGRALEAQKKFDEACKKFEVSQQLDAGVGTLLYLGDCYEQAGRFASAWATYKEAASAAHVAGEADREKIAGSLADALEPKLSRLTLDVAPEDAIDGFELRRDGEIVARGLWSVPVPLDAGTHHLEARAPGHASWASDVAVQGAGVTETTVPPLVATAPVPAPAAPQPAAAPAPILPAAAAPPPAAPDAAQHGGSAQRMYGYVVGGLGIASLAAGGVLSLEAKSKNSQANDYCGPDGFCTQQGVDLGNAAKGNANVATVFTIGGAIATAAGLVLIFTAPSSSSTASAARSVGFDVAAGPGSARATVRGSF